MNNRWPGAGLALVLGCLLLIAAHSACAQGNLVPNPSFELNDTCPYTIGFQESSHPLYWWSFGQSPDYFHACAGSLGGVDTLIRVPLNGFGFQYPLDGDAYVGMYARGSSGGNPNYREYVGCELLEPLEVGASYDLSFFTNVAVDGSYWWTRWACNNMGMLFTMEPNHWTGFGSPPFALRNYAHLHSTAIIGDTANWTLVSGSFVADSAYQYLMIGNHFDNAITDTLHFGSYPWNARGHTLIDNVCVSPNPDGCPLALGVPDSVLEGIAIYPNPSYGDVGLSSVPSGTRVVVRDAMGRLLWREEGVRGEWRKDVRAWPKGTYMLWLEWQGKSRSFKFVLIE